MAERPIFGIFEGGGAKGVAHVGALAACKRNELYFAGVAGASAGAIIAALIASGFTADELLDPEKPDDNILARYNETPLSLLGEEQWKQAQVYAEKTKLALSKKGTTGRRRAGWWLFRHQKPVKNAWARQGLISTDHVREVLNRILRDQISKVLIAAGEPGDVPERVTFRDFDSTRSTKLLPLKIIASNLDTKELAVFDRVRTPDLEVAHAVAASVAIPGMFEPVVISAEDGVPQRYMDGGAVSNLPVWVFANDKLAFERANPELGRVPIVGFTLAEKPKDPPAELADAGFALIQAALATALSGSQSLIQEFLQDLTVVPLKISLGTFDFDKPREVLINAYREALDCADRELRHHLTDYPRLVQAELANFHETMRRALLERLPKGRRRRAIILRASIIQRFDDDVFRVTFGHRMDGDADDRLVLDGRGPGAPQAYSDREVQLVPLSIVRGNPVAAFMTKYEVALLKPEIQAAISAPIFSDYAVWSIQPREDRPEPLAVVTLDADRARELEDAFNDHTFMLLFKAQSTLLYPALKTEPPRG